MKRLLTATAIGFTLMTTGSSAQEQESTSRVEEAPVRDDATDPTDVETRFRRLDADGDGRIHEDELPEELHALFERGDTDDDGFVDLDEWKRLALRLREARNGPSGLLRRLMELDLDEDGRLHRDEVPEAMEYLHETFDRFDLDGNDYLDGAEIRAMTGEPGSHPQARRRY